MANVCNTRKATAIQYKLCNFVGASEKVFTWVGIYRAIYRLCNNAAQNVYLYNINPYTRHNICPAHSHYATLKTHTHACTHKWPHTAHKQILPLDIGWSNWRRECVAGHYSEHWPHTAHKQILPLDIGWSNWRRECVAGHYSEHRMAHLTKGDIYLLIFRHHVIHFNPIL